MLVFDYFNPQNKKQPNCNIIDNSFKSQPNHKSKSRFLGGHPGPKLYNLYQVIKVGQESLSDDSLARELRLNKKIYGKTILNNMKLQVKHKKKIHPSKKQNLK